MAGAAGLTLNQCPICRILVSADWIDECKIFLVDCPTCTTFTIPEALARKFSQMWKPDDRQRLESLSQYLRRVGDDGDREVTEDSWMRLAAEEND